jgi:hypothetical protein
LAEVSQALAEATQSLEAVLGLVARRAVALIGNGGALFLASDDEAWLQPAAFDHRDPEGVLALRAMFASRPYRVTDDDAIRPVFRTGRPALLAVVGRSGSGDLGAEVGGGGEPQATDASAAAGWGGDGVAVGQGGSLEAVRLRWTTPAVGKSMTALPAAGSTRRTSPGQPGGMP